MSLGGSTVCFVAFLFGRSAWWKLASTGGFARVVARYPFAVRFPSIPWVAIVPSLELLIAVSVLLPLLSLGLGLALAFIVASSAAIVWRRLRGESRFACGCGGDFEEEDAASGMLLRNALLCLLLGSLIVLGRRPLLLDCPGGLALLLAWDLLRSASLAEGRVQSWIAAG